MGKGLLFFLLLTTTDERRFHFIPRQVERGQCHESVNKCARCFTQGVDIGQVLWTFMAAQMWSLRGWICTDAPSKSCQSYISGVFYKSLLIKLDIVMWCQLLRSSFECDPCG